MTENKIITRFAPSPTGELHIGGARTALFAYLFAKHNKGEFLLRIEDTDRSRYVEGSVERIIESLKWLGIESDNKKPMYQSDRVDIYKKAALELIEADKAYLCNCSKERLGVLREMQQKKKLPTGYDGHCRSIKGQVLGIKQLEEHLAQGAVVRMKMPEKGKIVVHDLIRGDVEFDLSLLDDQVILKSDGFPTYHLASIIDDHEMEVNYVIRAEEWLSSTPKHLVLYEMFGWKAPKFAHLPMVLAPDRTKLSKRHGATSVIEYKNLGYLPESIVNFLVLQGWNPKDGREEFSLYDLVEVFTLENVNKSPAIFDIQKLNDINEKKIRERITNHESRITKILDDFGLDDISDGELNLIGRGGYKTLKEAAEYILNLRQEPKYDASLLIFKRSDKKSSLLALREVLDKIEKSEVFDADQAQKILEYVVIEQGLGNGDVFWPVRVALSGSEKSPSPVELMTALGKEESVNRIKLALKSLDK